MAIIVNKRDVILQGTDPRMIRLEGDSVTITPTTNTFTTTASGTSPGSNVLRASVAGTLRGTVTWTLDPVVTATIEGNILTLPASSVPANTSVEVTATLTRYGLDYTDSVVISNIAESVVSSLSTNSVSISTLQDGTGGVYTSATSTMTVEIGAVDNSTAWTYSWSVPVGVAASGTTTRTITVSDMTVDDATLTCTATRTGWPTQTKTFTVSKAKAGTDGTAGTSGVAAYLTNPTHDLLANSGGVVYTAEYTSASTDFVIVEGGVTSTGWTYYVSAISAGVSYKDADDASARTGTGVTSGAITALPLSVASLTSDSAYVDITATKSGYTSITLRFSVTRISEAVDGVSPVLVNLTGTQAIAYDKDGVTPSPSSITFTATGKNVGTTTYYYRFKVDGVILGSVITNATGTVTSASYTAPTSFFSTPKTVLVEISTNSAMTNIVDTDTMSLVSSRVGATGNTGPAGANTATVTLYAKNTSGSTAPAAFTGTATYTFSTKTLTGLTLGTWSTAIPTLSTGEYLWVRQAIASSTTDTDTILIGEWSGAVVLSYTGTNGVNGLNSVPLFLYAKNTSGSTAPAAFTGTATYTFSTNALTGLTLGTWSRTAPSIASGEYLWVRQAIASSTTNTDTILIGEWSSAAVAGVGGATGATGPTGPTGPTGATGNKTALVSLYQWSPTQPGNPSNGSPGSGSTYTWSPPGNANYTGGNNWQTTVPANPGTPLLKLWVAEKSITDVGTATTTPVDWTTGVTVGQLGQNGSNGTNGTNGANGVQAAEAIVYQWALTIPTISGSSTYTWATGAVTSAPTNWFTTISDTGSAGQTLWAAKVALLDSVTVTTSTVNWATASIVPFGYSGSTGAVARIAYAATTIALSTSPSVYVVAGDNLPAVNSWNSTPVRVATTANITLSGLQTVDGVVLAAGDRVLVKNQTSSQNNGIYTVASGAWTRAIDADTWTEFVGLIVFVASGTINTNTFWQSNATAGGTLGSTAIAFTTTSVTTVTWTATTPTLTTGQRVWQSDGMYNPTTNQTIWEVPYLSSLKVGNLSAISTNTGSLTVSGNVTIGTSGNVQGGQTDYNTGTGFFLGYSGNAHKFSIGTPSAPAVPNTAADTLTLIGHGFVKGDSFYVINNNGNTDFQSNYVYYVFEVINSSTFKVGTFNNSSSARNLFSAVTITIAARSLTWSGTALGTTGKIDMFGDITIQGNLGTFRQRAKIDANALRFYGENGGSGIFAGTDTYTASYAASGFFVSSSGGIAAPTCSIYDTNTFVSLSISKSVAPSLDSPVVSIDSLNGAYTALELRGRLTATNMLRTTGSDTSPSTVFTTGKGIEVVYLPASNTGYVQSYNRDSLIWTKLYLSGSTVTVNGGGSGGSFGLLGIGTENFGTNATNTLAIREASTAPASSPANVGQLYVGPGTGHLMYRHPNGTVYQLTP